MDDAVFVEISENALDVQKACDLVTDPAHGAIDSFIGVVRNNHAGKEVTGITYDVHKSLAEKMLRQICEEARGIWEGTRYYVAHYQGDLKVGGVSVLITVSAAHRAESFEACRYVIEEIKKRAPVWKQEHYIDGPSEWLPGHSLLEEVEGETVCCGKCHVAAG